MSINVNDPLGDIASAISKFKEQTGGQCREILITEHCPFFKDIVKALDYEGAPTITVTKDCSPGISSYVNVGTTGHADHRGKSVVQAALDSINKAKFDNFCNDITDTIACAFDVPVEMLKLECNERRYMLCPEPVIEQPNNKPWYQDRKQNRSKKSRRKV